MIEPRQEDEEAELLGPPDPGTDHDDYGGARKPTKRHPSGRLSAAAAAAGASCVRVRLRFIAAAVATATAVMAGAAAAIATKDAALPCALLLANAAVSSAFVPIVPPARRAANSVQHVPSSSSASGSVRAAEVFLSSVPPGDWRQQSNYGNTPDDDEEQGEEPYGTQPGYGAAGGGGSGADDDGSAGSSSSKRERIKAKFDNMFSGMPSVGEILGGSGGGGDREGPGSDSAQRGGGNGPSRSGTSASRKRRQDKQDYSWFEDEKKQIMDNYQNILRDMLADLDEKRRADPESVPNNAEAMMKSVLKEEMDTEIESTREFRAQERLKKYEDELRADTDSKDVSGPPNKLVQDLIDESEEEFMQWEASRAQIDDFVRYEEEAFLRATKDLPSADMPEKGTDLDKWALERLEAMADTRQDTEGGEAILDILEENVSVLRQRMEKEAKKEGSLKPETMKEWQMYRAIATRQALEDTSSETERGSEDAAAREQRILDQLDSWKDYIQKETSNRKESGLARGPRLPFEWQESDLTKPKAGSQKADTRSRVEVRKEINRMSIEALESLLVTSDPQRRENLQNEIDYLRSNLESRDYLDIEEEEVVEETSGPVDLTGVFQTSSVDDESPAGMGDRRGEMAGTYSEQPSEPAQIPNTPFYSGGDEAAAEPLKPPETPFFSEGSSQEASPPPGTPFFSGGTEETAVGDVAARDSKLGGMEEQKLQAMYRRAGVRSDEEQARIKKEYEEFQRIEEEKRKQSGLSADAESEGVESAGLKYNVSEVMREDGDIDAEKVLASIGPRPTRKKKDPSAPAKQAVGGQGSLEAGVDDQDPSMKSSIQEEDVRDSLYRAVSAVGGGRFKDDPEAKAKQQTSFEEFLQKEDEMRRSLDSLDEAKLEGDVESDPDVDDVEYAEEVISSLGPRPKPKRSRIIDEGEFSDKGGILASKDEAEEDEEDSIGESSVWDSMPEWLRKEKEQGRSRSDGTKGSFLGSDIDEVFDDDQYDKNMRQLHEYEQRRTGRQRQMGIDISDVIGRRAYDTDDYADYKYDDDSFRIRQSGGWGDASFYSRKKNLLEYTELDMRELTSLMDLKDSPYSTGVSQYLPRINKPFKEFGAIFRLEGVLVDVAGLQLKAWTKVAEEFEFKPPEIDDVRRASVIRPEVAVKDALFWTDDFILCRKAAIAHKKAFREAFDDWMKEMGVEQPVVVSTGDGGTGGFLGEEVAGDGPAPASSSSITGESAQEQISAVNSTGESVGSSTKAWTVIAEAYGKPIPSQAELFHAASLSPATAIRGAFLWSDDPSEVDKIEQSYNQYMATGNLSEANGKADPLATVLPEQPSSTEAAQPGGDGSNMSGQQRVLDQNAIMEIHYYAWKKVAERFRFESPEPEEAMAAFVINDPEIAVRDGFGWTDDPQLTKEAVEEFKTSLNELMKQNSITVVSESYKLPEKAQQSPTRSHSSPTTTSSGPSEEDLTKMQIQAWTSTAQANGFPAPAADVVLLAQKVEPREAITRLFRWTYETDSRIETIAATYEATLKDLTQKYGLPLETKPVQTGGGDTPRRAGPSQDEIFRAVFDAWLAVAKSTGHSEPDIEQVQFALSVGPEEAVITGFEWADDVVEAAKLVEMYKREIGIRRQQWSGGLLASSQSGTPGQDDDEVPPFTAIPYASDWVKSLLDVEMRCCVVSYLERYQVDVLLDMAGLSDLFGNDCRVSSSDGYAEDNQQLLGAALRCERRPDHCVVFDTSPYASIAAHDVDMRNVNIIGVYPRYELLSADSTTDSFAGLTAMNVRRLFGERVYDQPMMETQQAAPSTQKKAKTQFWDEE